VIVAKALHQLLNGAANRDSFLGAQIPVADHADQEWNPVLVGWAGYAGLRTSVSRWVPGRDHIAAARRMHSRRGSDQHNLDASLHFCYCQ